VAAKKTKARRSANKSAQKSADAKKADKQKGEEQETKVPDVKQVRENISNLVRASATKIAKGVITVAETGQLANAKYLFEAAGVYPAPQETAEKPKGEPLAQTLLRRLGLPTDPVVREDEPEPIQLPGVTQANDDNAEEEAPEPKCTEDQKGDVAATESKASGSSRQGDTVE
jgi:hypothetical protein